MKPLPGVQPTIAVCHCGAAERTTLRGAAFDYPDGWDRPTTDVPAVPGHHAHKLVCGLCPEHAALPQGWSGRSFPSDEEIEWPEDIRA
jgi:hypothetical protein